MSYDQNKPLNWSSARLVWCGLSLIKRRDSPPGAPLRISSRGSLRYPTQMYTNASNRCGPLNILTFLFSRSYQYQRSKTIMYTDLRLISSVELEEAITYYLVPVLRLVFRDTICSNKPQRLQVGRRYVPRVVLF